MERKTTSSSRTNTGNACRLPTGGTAARAVRTQQGLTGDLPGYARHLLHSDDEHLVRSTATRWDKLVCTAADPDAQAFSVRSAGTPTRPSSIWSAGEEGNPSGCIPG